VYWPTVNITGLAVRLEIFSVMLGYMHRIIDRRLLRPENAVAVFELLRTLAVLLGGHGKVSVKSPLYCVIPKLVFKEVCA
jgi:hypothetical protein